MPGITTKNDSAGGAQTTQANGWYTIDGAPVVVVGDGVAGHGDSPHDAPTMAEGEGWYTVGGIPVCREGNTASCGHATTGNGWYQMLPHDPGPPPRRDGAPDGVTCPVDGEHRCSVENIPHIMRANGLTHAATLLERWMWGLASTDRDTNPPDTTTVTMDWVLSFDRIKGLIWYKHDVGNPIWASSAAQQAIGEKLKREGYLRPGKVSFNWISGDPIRMKKDQTSYISLSGFFYPVDDLYATLGNFSIYYVVAGFVNYLSSGNYQVTLNKVGYFVYDSFDFNGNDKLGSWECPDKIISGGCTFYDSTFREWRKKTGYGMDFYVFSDLKIEDTHNHFIICP